MCDNETYDALSLWKVFDQTFFPKPLGRNFSEFADALREFVEGDQKDWGGLISPRTSLPPTVSEAEAKLYLGTWAMMKACAALPTPDPARFRLTSSGGSPFILSVDFARNSNKPEGERNWPSWIVPLVSNRHLISISQDPLSLQGHRLWSDGVNGSNANSSAGFVPPGLREVWVGPLAEGEAAMMFVNKAESLSLINASFALAGPRFAGCHNVTLFDVLGQRELGWWVSGRIGMSVQPHSAEILRLGCAD